MVWAYFDETVVHLKVEGQDGQPAQYLPRELIVGGCVGSLEKWKEFEPKWRQALKDENVNTFHAKDFYAFRREFEWYTPEGEAEIVDQQCLKARITPAQVASLVLFLASDDGRMCTGHEYWIDAGWG